MISQFRRFSAGRSDVSRFSGQKAKAHPAVVFACQSLEPRRLLSDASGVVFHDVNVNRQQDRVEALLQGFTVYADYNANNTLDQGEPSTLSNTLGQWRLEDLRAGKTQIRLQRQPGYTAVPNKPGAGYWLINPTEDASVTNLDFGAVKFASVKGRVYFDVNGDGVSDGGDNGLAGTTVFIDANRNGILDTGERSTQTNNQGQYRIDYLYPGVNPVRVQLPEQYVPSTQIQRVGNLPSGYDATNINFGITQNGNIIGHVFSDDNGDGIQAPGEQDKAGQVVYLDINNNGQWDRGVDPAAKTNAQGNYFFVNLKPGGYNVRVATPALTQITTPQDGNYAVTLSASQTVSKRNFGLAPFGRIQGYVFADNNGNGAEDFGEDLLPGRHVFLDYNGNRTLDAGEPDAWTNLSGRYILPRLPNGRYFVDIVTPQQQINTYPATGRHIVDVRAGDNTTEIAFGMTLTGEIRGRVFNDANGNGFFDAGETSIPNRRVYIDANGNGLFDRGETSALTGPAGVYSLPDLKQGNYLVRTIPIPNTFATTPPNGVHVVGIVGGSLRNNRNFGFAQPGTLSGVVFNDTNGDGVQNIGESGRANVLVYVDSNLNGVLTTGEPSTLTDGLGAFNLTGLRPGAKVLTIETPVGFQISVPDDGSYTTAATGGQNRGGFVFGLYQPATISGVVFNDVNQNGVQNVGEAGLFSQRVFLDLNSDGLRSFDEPVQFTDFNGAYAFANLQPGVYDVRLIVDAGNTVTVPAGGVYTGVTVISGQTVAGRNFGLVLPASISGTVFNDDNGNGVRDVGETGAVGQTVFIDANSNGALEVGEQTAVTAANGSYTFSPLDPGVYVIRLDVQVGDTLTTPPANIYTLNVVSGQTLIGNDFGITSPATISGVVYTDNDGDGTRDAGDPFLPGVTVYLDINENGVLDGGEDSQVTDAGGAYTFTVNPGTYDVRINAPAGTDVTDAPGGFYDDLTVTSGQVGSGTNFGVASSVSGFAYDDIDTDGVFNNADTPVAGIRVFADVNANGVFDPGEPTDFTAAITGTYRLAVTPGTYDIYAIFNTGTPINPAGGVQAGVVVPVGGGATGVNFGADLP